MTLLIELFISFFQIGLFTIGGGYAALPLIQNQIVNVHGWLTVSEMADVITISQMTPGPIGINAATFVGTRLYGVLGSIVATLGLVTPSCIIVLIISYFYFKYKEIQVIQGILKGIRPVVIALIASAAIVMVISSFFDDKNFVFELKFLSGINLIAVFIFTACLIVLRKFKTDPIIVMSGAGIAGMILYQIF